MKSLKYTISALLLMIFSCVSFAGPHHAHHRLEMMKEKLELTDAQYGAVEEIFRSSKEQAKPIHSELKQIKKSIRNAMKADPVDESAIKSLSAQAAQKKAELMIIRAKSRKLVEEQLTEEQVSKMKAFKEKHGKRRHARWENTDEDL